MGGQTETAKRNRLRQHIWKTVSAEGQRELLNCADVNNFGEH